MGVEAEGVEVSCPDATKGVMGGWENGGARVEEAVRLAELGRRLDARLSLHQDPWAVEATVEAVEVVGAGVDSPAVAAAAGDSSELATGSVPTRE